MDTKLYLVGNKNELQSRYPNYDWDHARKSLAGDEAVIEEEITPAQQDYLESNGIYCLTHAEAIEYLNDPSMEGIWYITAQGGE